MRGVVSGNIGKIQFADFIGQYFVLKFSVAEACFVSKKVGEVTTWHNCEWWGGGSEDAVKHLEVGDHIDVFGQVYIHEWEKDEVTQKKLVVKVTDALYRKKAAGSVGDFKPPEEQKEISGW